MNLVPDVADLGHTDDIVRKRLGAVVDEEDKAGSEQHQADQTEEKADHDSNESGMISGDGYSCCGSDSIVVCAAWRDGPACCLLRREDQACGSRPLSTSPPAATFDCPGISPGV